jgi:aspartyl-tRNA(Asn)/glutamyl-tRNA(Gln) amidotransferase subunit C
MAIQRDDVRWIAELARLEIPDDAIERTAAELTRVLDFVAALDRLDLNDIEPDDPGPVGEPLRDDLPDGECLDAERATAMAPAAENGYFLVPPIVEHLEP